VAIDPAEDVPAINTGSEPITVRETAQAEAEGIPQDRSGLYSGVRGRLGGSVR
jgi:hypothetical protein